MSNDLISRQAVNDLISNFILEIHSEGGRDLNAHTNDVLRQILRNVKSDRALPPVTPQPCGDAISRQAVLDLAERGFLVGNHNYKSVCNAINDLPSVTPTQNCVENALGALNCISRQAVEEIINDIRDCISVEGYCAILERLKKLPPVNPQEPKTDVLDKIRAEIVDLGKRTMNDNRASGIWACRDIIDKYKTESEG